MKTTQFLLLSLLAVGFASCSEDVDLITDNGTSSYVDDGTGIKIEVTDEFAGAMTRADYSGFPATTFEEGDAIGVYAFNGSSYVSSNIKFTRQSDGSWTPASKVIYNPDYTYFAYFPWVSSVPSTPTSSGTVDTRFASWINSNTFWLANQSTKVNFTASNLMLSQGVSTGSRTVQFTMEHKRGLAIISDAVNQWYYTNDEDTKFTLTPVFSGNIPYVEGGTRYFLMKPNTATTVAGLSLRASAGKYMRSEGIELTGNPSISYQKSTNGGSSWSSSSKPEWITVSPQVVEGSPTHFAITESAGGRTVAGDATLKSATPVSNVDLSMVNNDGTSRVDGRTTANCYLVHAPGTYKLPLVYGNAIKDGDDTQTTSFYTTNTSNTLQRLVNHANVGITTPWIKTQLGSCPDGAQLIWEDVKGLISAVGIDQTTDNGYLTFTVDEDNIAEGNAVIAATLDGTIVWSWHIWVTTETLTDSRLTTISAAHTYKLAPVNIGQVNGTIKLNAATAGEMSRVTVSSNGVSMTFDVSYSGPTQSSSTIYYPSPYYQWGRKDAMYPSTGGYNSSGTLINTYTSGTTLITETSATPGATIQHPDYWYYNSSNYGPYGTNSTYAGKYNYWDMVNTSLDNSNSTSRKVATVKTVYDPCPPDFCVPTSNCFYYIYSNYSSYFKWASTPPGRTWSMNGASVYFPASGFRLYSSGSLRNVGSYGYCWAATPFSTDSGRYLYFYSGSTYWNSSNRSGGFPVRAVAEE